MSEVTTNVLRAAYNNVDLVGVLKSKEVTEGTNDKGGYITIDCVIATSPESEHKVKITASRMTKGTKDRPSEESGYYKGLCTVRDTYVSVADLMKKDMSFEEAFNQADKVSISRGSLTKNEYYNQGGQLVSRDMIRASALSRVKPEEYHPMARFDIEGYIEKKHDEMVNEEETGRIFLDMLIPEYGGKIIPMRFVTTKEAGSYIRNHYEIGNTVRIYGELIDTVQKTETRIEGFMKEEVKMTTTHVHEYLVDNGSPEPYDEESNNAYKRNDILNALKVRETEYLSSLLERSKNRSNRPAAAAGFAAANAGFVLPNNSFAPPQNKPFSLSDL